MLTELKLRNFKQHKELEVSFTSGVNVIVGPNWSGKTTILQGVLYALFGASAVPVTVNELKTDNASGAMEVSLSFRLNGAGYQVVRGLRTAAIKNAEGKDLATGQTAVTAKIEELFGISAKSFLAVRYSAANEAASILTHGAGKFAQTLSEITGVDIIDRSLETLRLRSSKESGVLEGLQRTATSADPVSVTLMEDEISRLKTDLTVVQKQADEVATELNELHPKLVSLKQEHERRREGFLQCQKVSGAREAYEERIEALEADLVKAVEALFEPTHDLKKEEERLAELRQQELKTSLHAQQVKELGGRVEKARILHERAAQAYDNAKKFGPRTATIASVSETLKEALERKEDLAKRVGQAKDAVAVATKELSSASCHACGRPFEDRDVATLEKALTKAGEDWNKWNETYEKTCEEVSAIAANLTDLHALQDEIDSCEKEKQRTEQDYKSLQAELQKVSAESVAAVSNTDLDEAGSRVQAARDEATLLEQRRYTVSRLEQELNAAKQAVEALPVVALVTEQDVTLAEKAAHKASTHYAERWQVYNQIVEEAKGIRQSLDELEKSYKEMEEQAETLAKQEALIGNLKELSKYLRANRDRFTSELWENLLLEASRFASECTQGKISEVGRTDAGGFVYVEDGVTRSVAQASGLQGAIIGTGVKLALAAAVPSSANVLVLDEVSAGARDENALTMAQALSETGHQVLLVTHRDHDASVAENVISLG